ncbi:MAG: helix-turn-helix transcriptional regulator, partial [Clostridia bacterium]|nr:helix-turn-helix transcriptional regulator [Clostridia bacterium]
AIDTLLEFFFENYPRHISLDEMAALVHLNKSYLVRLFRREIGQTPLDYLNGIRISSARELLHSTDLKVSEVAFRCGFESASYFIRRFSAACGETPEQYRLARPSEKQ